MVGIAFIPILLCPIGGVLGFLAYRQGESLGRVTMIVAGICLVLGFVLGAVVLTAST